MLDNIYLDELIINFLKEDTIRDITTDSIIDSYSTSKAS